MAHSKNSTEESHDQIVLRHSHVDVGHVCGFLGALGDLQREGELQDVVLEVEGRRFPCHRLVLSAASPYFRAMFTNDMAESRQQTVVLQGFDADVFEEILSYIYSGTLQLSLDRVQPLYQAADLLQLDYVRDKCSSYMAMNVECSTCADLYKFADVFSLDVVRKDCLQCIHRNFVEVSSSEEFCSLSVDQLTEIISHDELEVKEETGVWEAVVRWVQHSREDRLHYLPSILPHIRFNLLTSDDTAAILEHPLVREDPGSAEVIKNVVKEASNQKPRLGMTTEMFLLGYSVDEGKEDVHYINPQQGKYIKCSYENLLVTNMTVTSDNNIYALPSVPEDVEQVSLCKYNHADNVWEHAGMSSVSKLPSHYLIFLLEVNQVLFYIGTDVTRGGAVVEVRKYNQHTDQWQECSLLEYDKEVGEDEDSTEDDLDGTVLSCGPYIYFITNDDMYRYDPSQDRWHERDPPLLIPDGSFCTAVTMGTEIFCTNFYFTDTMLYDTELDSWQTLQGWPNPANLAIHNFFTRPALFVLENQLHILVPCDVGQEQTEHRHLVFVYDRSADVWTEKVTLPNDRCRYSVPGSVCPVARFYLPYLVQDKDT